METVFEVFDSRDGKPQGYRHTERKALETCERIGGFMDYLPAREEGFYVIDMRDFVKAGPFECRRDAEDRAGFENRANDNNSFSVTEHRL